MGIIVFIFFIALLNGRINSLKSKAQKDISLCSSVQEAIAVRKEFDEKSGRSTFIVLVLYIICACLITFTIESDLRIDSPFFLTLLIFIIPIDYLILKERAKKYTFHPVSKSSIHDIKYPYYALFLRGFDNDDYNTERMLGSGSKKDNKKKDNSKRFSEVRMKNKIETNCCNHIVAIGMPQEVFAPIGCERIYCEPESWKQDVLHLINNSLFNIVLLEDRPNCLYELERCLQVASKTYCIVYDRDMYENLRQTFSVISSVSIQEPFFFRLDNPTNVRRYHPTIFALQIKKDLKGLPNEKTQQLIKELEEEKEYNNIKMGCLLTLVVVFIIYITCTRFIYF